MSKRAEEKALEAYPYFPTEVNLFGHKTITADGNSHYRGIYIKGYELAEKDLGWHSVDESLPPIDEEVIVLTNRVRDIELDSATRICFAHIVDRSLAIDWDGWNIPGVRYWMPMPKIKEEEV